MPHFPGNRVRWLAVVVFVVGNISIAEEPTTGKANRPGSLGKVPVIRFPGRGFLGELPKLTADEVELSTLLRQHVEKLATDIGERNLLTYDSLKATSKWLDQKLTEFGYKVERQSFEVDRRECQNLIVQRSGKKSPDEIVVIGAHYDSALDAPGANDNGSGTAALLELARRFARYEPNRTLRLALFVNEEPPYFHSDNMGSMVYARRCKERKENIAAVLCLETIGYYTDKENSQHYPFPLGAVFPKTGNFIGFVGDVNSGPLVSRVLNRFRKDTQFPSEATSLPGDVEGVGWSDHWSFWKFGYQGVMVTDTALFRYPHYHLPTDTPDKLDYERMARVVSGLERVIADLVDQSDLN